MDARDLRISRKLQKIMRKLDTLAEKEIGERVGLALVLFPYVAEGESTEVKREYHYISNTPRTHMHGALKSIVEKWDEGHVDIAPHEMQ